MRMEIAALYFVLALPTCGQERQPSMNATFPETEWRDGVVVLMQAINADMGKPALGKPLRSIEVDHLPRLIKQLVTGTYQPRAWFSEGRQQTTLGTRAPATLSDIQYQLLRLPAADPLSKFYSMRSGGILFEDPFYALLAAYNVGRTKKLLLLPEVVDLRDAWRRRAEIVELLARKEYHPERFFVECLPSRGPLHADFVIVKGDILQGLRQEGLGEIAGEKGLAKYALYFRR